MYESVFPCFIKQLFIETTRCVLSKMEMEATSFSSVLHLELRIAMLAPAWLKIESYFMNVSKSHAGASMAQVL